MSQISNSDDKPDGPAPLALADGSALLVPSEWEKITGIEVLDPDGWRVDKTPWDKPITHSEFMVRCGPSTCKGLVKHREPIDLRARVEYLELENAGLRKALEPFAQIGDIVNDDDCTLWKRVVSAGDVRRARELVLANDCGEPRREGSA